LPLYPKGSGEEGSPHPSAGNSQFVFSLLRNPEILFLVAAASSALIGLLVTPLVRMLALRANFIDHPGERKIHSAPIAYGGGIAVALSALLAVGAVLYYKDTNLTLWRSQEDLHPGLTLWILAAAALGALALGLIDDKFKLSPYTKLAGQAVLAIAVVAGGVRITAFIGDNLVMQTVTVIWIVLITNSFNLLDNMDGLCSGTVAIAAAMLGLVAMESSQWNLMIVLAALCGACLAFLRYNFSPATIFLGDGGSLFVGFVMACCTVMVTYYRASRPSHMAIGIPLLILAIPIYDTLSVILIRLKERRPLMRGDNSHFSHRLVDLGMTRRQAVATIHLACLAIGLPATVLVQFTGEQERYGLLIVGQALLVLTIVALLERAGRNRAEKTPASKIETPEMDEHEHNRPR